MSGGKSVAEIDLDRIKVALVTDYFERDEVETLLSRYHPLGAKKAKGARLCYAASYKGEWVAVLLFDAPVLRSRLREHRIGWTDEQRGKQLSRIANNSRYLIAPRYTGVKNLASKVLSLVTQRISKDWQRRYGVALLAVETYVDPQYNDHTGACYLAAGWENLGISTGYQRFGEERTHGKIYLLKALHKDSFAALRSEIPHALVTGVKDASGKSNNNYVLDASKFNMRALQDDLRQIADPRRKQGRRYELVPFLSLCIAAVISGYTQYSQIADWIAALSAPERARFGLRADRKPTEVTVGNILRAIDPQQLQTVLSNWLLKTYGKSIDFDTVLMDGKAQRATSWNADRQKGFLNVMAGELGIVVEHQPTSKGGGEKTTAHEIMESGIDLEGKIVIADAIYTDRPMIDDFKKKEPRMSSLLKVIKAF
jgi:hypothetical protein